jgi:hypothetical protein
MSRPHGTAHSRPKMDDDSSKSLRDRLDALLRRAREISAEIEKRVEEVTAEPSTSGSGKDAAGAPGSGPAPAHQLTPEKVAAAQEAMEVAAEAVAVSAEAAAVTAEALSTIADETGTAPAVPPGPPTTVVPEAATAVAQDATEASREDAANKKAPAVAPVISAPPAAEAKAVTQAAPDKKPDDKS